MRCQETLGIKQMIMNFRRILLGVVIALLAADFVIIWKMSHTLTVPISRSLPWIDALVSSLMAVLVFFYARATAATETVRAQVIAEHINDGLLSLENGKIVFANPPVRKLLGTTTGNPILTPEVAAIIKEAEKSLTPVIYETQVDGYSHHFLVSKIALPESTNNGSKPYQVYVFRDVTFLRENEEAKVNFIGALSHEIKTPITSLAMALAMLDRAGYDAELVRIANIDIGRLRILLDDLLNISRLKLVRDPGALHKRDTNLTTLLHQSIKSAENIALDKGVKLTYKNVPRGQVMANIDPTKITWVLSTLLTDAIRQTQPGESVSVVFDLDGPLAVLNINYKRRFDSLGPTGHAIVRDIIDAHAGRFVTMHRAELESSFKFSISAYLTGVTTTKGNAKHEANLIG